MLDHFYRKYTFSFVNGPEAVGMASGATIHTANGLKVRVQSRQLNGQSSIEARGKEAVGASA